jgi:hypothetical protein
MARTETVQPSRRRFALAWLMLLAVVAALLTIPSAPARAAIPDRWGFAYNNLPNPPAGFVMPTTRQWGSWKTAFPASWATVTQVGPGFYQVRFPNIGGKGVAHVTAVNVGPISCQLAKWGPSGVDELIYVRCHAPGGAPADSAFSIVYSESSGLGGAPYGWVWGAAGGGVVNGFNASGAPNTVALTGVGQYDVKLPNLGGGFDGNLQVTAVHSQLGARCKVAAWIPAGTDQRAIVRCHDTTGAPLYTDFTLTYHHKVSVWGGSPTRFGYLWDTFGAIPPGANVNSAGATNTVVSAGVGLRLVTFPRIGLDQSQVQVTAYGPGPEFCNLLTQWWIIGVDAVVRDVACYDPSGVRVNQRSFVTYGSRF